MENSFWNREKNHDIKMYSTDWKQHEKRINRAISNNYRWLGKKTNDMLWSSPNDATTTKEVDQQNLAFKELEDQ